MSVLQQLFNRIRSVIIFRWWLWLVGIVFSICIPVMPVFAAPMTQEFQVGVGGPAGNGPSIANESVLMYRNTDNPTGTTFTASTNPVTVTLSLSNFQHSVSTANISTGRAIGFGVTSPVSGSTVYTGTALYATLNGIGSPSDSMFSSLPSTVGQGISVTNNGAVQLMLSTLPLYNAGAATNGRYYYGDLTISFSRPLTNPTLHFSGLGGSITSNSVVLGFTTELDLDTAASPGITLSKVSGTSNFMVNSSQILNNALHPNASCATGVAACGSVLATGNAISSVKFKVYLRGDGGLSTWSATGGDAFYFAGASILDEYDYGDAPDTGTGTGTGNYQTLASDSGPSHLASGITLGTNRDADTGTLQNSTATLDDTTGTPDDEDGVTLPASFIQGAAASISANVSGSGYLNAWIDWNRDGDFADVGEQIATDQAVTAGTNTLNITVPGTISSGSSFARFRVCSTAGNCKTPTGMASDGEVEDYQVTLSVPVVHNCPAGTTATGSGYATGGTGLYRDELFWLDWSCNGETFATGDTVNKSWTLPSGLVVNAQITNITESMTSYITGTWTGDKLDDFYSGLNPIGLTNSVDSKDPAFDISFSVTLNGKTLPADIVWADAEDTDNANEYLKVTTDGNAFQPLEGIGVLNATFSNGGKTLLLNDLAFAGSGTLLTMSENVSKLSVDMNAGGKQAIAFGVFIPFDYGDAPNTYASTLGHYVDLSASGGSQPTTATTVTALTKATITSASTYYLGTQKPDTEKADQPNATATGDDSDTLDDEDGMTLPAALVAGAATTLTAKVTGAGGYLQAWVDWNGDNDFADAGEQIATDLQDNGTGDTNATTGTIAWSVTPPSGLVAGTRIARFRWSSTSGITATGTAADGEIEDYAVTAVKYDYSDAPATYGAPAHAIVAGMHIGAADPDSEAAAMPGTSADGDDTTGSDDEDGVTLSSLTQGQSATISATIAGTGGYLQGWIDWNADGDFADAGEQIITNLQDNGSGDTDSTTGKIAVSLTVPATASSTTTYARFRWSSTQGLTATAVATDGEVEDYTVTIITGMSCLALPVTTVGNATVLANNEYQLTPALNSQIGAVWGTNRINLAQPFDYKANVFLGAADSTGADGMTFTLQNTGSTAIGRTGRGIGSGDNESGTGITPSLVVELDTYNNGDLGWSDPVDGSNDHLGVYLNGNGRHNGAATALAGPVNLGNIENNAYHTFRVTWNPATKTLVTYFDEVQRSSNVVDLITNLGTTTPYWGYTASTGGYNNRQAVCNQTDPTAAIQTDLSDAPSTYGNASHKITSGISLGTGDPDADNISASLGSGADVDDNTGTDDENGVTLPALTNGQSATITVAINQLAAGSGYLQGWIDFNGDGDFADTGEQIATNLQYSSGISGTISIPVTIPSTAMTSAPTYARFRWSTTKDLTATAAANDGEVEDYALTIQAASSSVPATSCPAGTIPSAINLFPNGDFAIVPSDDWHTVLNGVNNTTPGHFYADANFYSQARNVGYDTYPADNSFGGAANQFSIINGNFSGWSSQLAFPGDPANNVPATANWFYSNGNVLGSGDASGPLSAEYLLWEQDATNLVVGKTYVFSSYVSNVGETDPPDLPIIRLRVGGTTGMPDGTVVFGPYNLTAAETLNSKPLNGWKRVEYTFTATSPSAKFKFTSAAKGVVGDDFALSVLGVNQCVPISADLGDAPSSYDIGSVASHVIPASPTVYLGSKVPDADSGAVSPLDGTGDDVNGTDDEDGVTLPAMARGQSTSIMATVAGTGGYLQGWIDWNGDGDFADTGEQIATNLQDNGAGDTDSTTGKIAFTVSVPATAITTQTYARFRWSTTQNLTATAAANDGEVEDYALAVSEVDYSDAPASYGTPSHAIVAGVHLGAADPDGEAAANPGMLADGDDTTGSDDEDGIVLNGDSTQMMIKAHTSNALTNTITVTPSVAGYISLWIDNDHNGAFDAAEQIFNDKAVTAGSQTLSFNIPSTIRPGLSYLRIRYSTVTGQANTATGAASDGEVEDYQVKIRRDTSPIGCSANPTTIYTSLDMGFFERVDTLTHWARNAGVLPDGTVVDVRITLDGAINSWDVGETAPGDAVTQMLFNASVTRNIKVEFFEAGTNTPVTGNFILNIGDIDGDNRDVSPVNGLGDDNPAMPVTSYTVTDEYQHFYNIANFELDTATRLYQGAASNPPTDLLIESAASNNYDATLTAKQLAVRLAWENVNTIRYSYFTGQFGGTTLDAQGFNTYNIVANCYGNDYSDAPATYGAPNHTITPGVHLGAADPDSDSAAMPGASATGDDTSGSDDEDGITLPAAFTKGVATTITATVAGAGGYLQGWIDWNADGDFADTGEQVITNVQDNGSGDTNNTTGTIAVTVTPPATLTAGPSYARFRWSTTSALSATAPAIGGEVEDYAVTISNSTDYGDAPASYGTPAHAADANLFIGATAADTESAAMPSTNADGDDASGSADEDGIASFPLLTTASTSYQLNVKVTNKTGQKAWLVGWIDFNGNGAFDNNEAATVSVITGTNNKAVGLKWKKLSGLVGGTTYARLRLTTDASIATGKASTSQADGAANDGEVEDYALTISDGGYTISGKVFHDSNVNGADDNEVGIKNVTVVLYDKAQQSCVSVHTGADGGYAFSGVPAAAANNYVLYEAAAETIPTPTTCPPAANDPNGYVSSTVNTATVSVTNADVTGVDFGDVAKPSFLLEDTQAILPDTSVVYPHVFESKAEGSVTFSVVQEDAEPANLTWGQSLWLDTQCDGKLDAADTALTSALAVQAGDKLCVLAKVVSPAQASTGAAYTLTLQSEFVYGDGNSGLANDIQTRTDITKTSAGTEQQPVDGTGKLSLEKSVWNVTRNMDGEVAKPGETLRYTIHYENIGDGTLQELDVHDSVPAFTTLVTGSAKCLTTPAALGQCMPVISAEALEWTFTGSLPAGASGDVAYEVVVQ